MLNLKKSKKSLSMPDVLWSYVAATNIIWRLKLKSCFSNFCKLIYFSFIISLIQIENLVCTQLTFQKVRNPSLMFRPSDLVLDMMGVWATITGLVGILANSAVLFTFCYSNKVSYTHSTEGPSQQGRGVFFARALARDCPPISVCLPACLQGWKIYFLAVSQWFLGKLAVNFFRPICSKLLLICLLKLLIGCVPFCVGCWLLIVGCFLLASYISF